MTEGEEQIEDELPQFTSKDAEELSATAQRSPTCFDFLDALRERSTKYKQECAVPVREVQELSFDEVAELLAKREAIIEQILGNEYQFDDPLRSTMAAIKSNDPDELLELASIEIEITDRFIDFPTRDCVEVIRTGFDRDEHYPLFRNGFRFGIQVGQTAEEVAIEYNKIFAQYGFLDPMKPHHAACALEILQHLPLPWPNASDFCGPAIGNILSHIDELVENRIPFRFFPNAMDGLLPGYRYGPNEFPEGWISQWIVDPIEGEELLGAHWSKHYFTRKEGADTVEQISSDMLRRQWLPDTRHIVAAIISIHLFRVVQNFGELSSLELPICQLFKVNDLCEFEEPQELILRVLRYCDDASRSDIACLQHLKVALTEHGVDTDFLQINQARTQQISSRLQSPEARQAVSEYASGILDMGRRDVSDPRSILTFQGMLQRLSVAFEKETLDRARTLSSGGASSEQIRLNDAISAIEGYCILKKQPTNVTVLRLAQSVRNDCAHNVVQFNPTHQCTLEDRLLSALEWLLEFPGDDTSSYDGTARQ